MEGAQSLIQKAISIKYFYSILMAF